jgi:uncharacterized protein YbjT (DUF2867 family)/uncharacterized membrane protein YphA (DoxX/SURF4 family)
MRVLVTGAYGFIGAHITAALVASGHDVVCAVREARIDSRFTGLEAIACDMSRDTDIRVWLPRLVDIEAVVNCAGILRETDSDTFYAVHEQSPQALFEACVQRGIRRVIQISALGDRGDGEFIASKHRCDDALAQLPMDWLVLRPSLVYSAQGSYGGTSLLRGLAALPWLIPVPGKGDQPVQPVCAEDVGVCVVAALRHSSCTQQILQVVGPDVLSLREYLLAWRRWLGFAAPHVWSVPAPLVRLAAHLGERFGKGPLGVTMTRMLERGNVGADHALRKLRDELGVVPRKLTRVLDASPSHVQDRWHARLYFLLPALRIAMALLWIFSGFVGWLVPASKIAEATPGNTLSLSLALVLARGTATADLILGALCLIRRRSRLVLSLMLAMLLGYTLSIGTLWPEHWLDPFGSLIKNVPLIAALLVLLATDERR